jgi:hypothetical protein
MVDRLEELEHLAQPLRPFGRVPIDSSQPVVEACDDGGHGRVEHGGERIIQDEVRQVDPIGR